MKPCVKHYTYQPDWNKLLYIIINNNMVVSLLTNRSEALCSSFYVNMKFFYASFVIFIVSVLFFGVYINKYSFSFEADNALKANNVLHCICLLCWHRCLPHHFNKSFSHRSGTSISEGAFKKSQNVYRVLGSLHLLQRLQLYCLTIEHAH